MGSVYGTQVDSYCRTATSTKTKLFVSWKTLSNLPLAVFIREFPHFYQQIFTYNFI